MQLVEYIFSIDSAFILVLLLLGFFLLNFKRKSFVSVNGNSPPEPRGAWPILGHLPSILGMKNVHLARIFADYAEKHGHIFTFKLGMASATVISSHEAFKECFTINDKVFATRPPSTVGEYLGFNNAIIGFAPYGPYWSEIRKVVVVELLSSKKIETHKHVRASELETSIKELCCFLKIKNGKERKAPVKVELSKWIEQLTMNIVVKSISGKRYVNSLDGDEDEEAKYFRRVTKEYMYATGLLLPSDLIPFSLVKWIDFGGHIKKMKAILHELNIVLQSWFDEHVQSRMDSPEAVDGRDFIDALLSTIDDKFTCTGHDKETIIKATVMTLILGGADTTSVQVTWAMSLLLNNPHIVKRALEEIDSHIGRDRWVEESDMKNLIYLQAIQKETLRLYPSVPLSLPHQAMEDCTVCGYSIRKGSRLIVDIWKLHRDPRVWSNPNEFNPERFLGGSGKEDSINFEYTPFGSGRRSCPGNLYALQIMHLTLARLLQGFHFSTPDGLPVDMTEGLGVTMPKANPLEVLIMPRLHGSMYC